MGAVAKPYMRKGSKNEVGQKAGTVAIDGYLPFEHAVFV
jgi:hypothetical protein